MAAMTACKDATAAAALGDSGPPPPATECCSRCAVNDARSLLLKPAAACCCVACCGVAPPECSAPDEEVGEAAPDEFQPPGDMAAAGAVWSAGGAACVA